MASEGKMRGIAEALGVSLDLLLAGGETPGCRPGPGSNGPPGADVRPADPGPDSVALPGGLVRFSTQAGLSMRQAVGLLRLAERVSSYLGSRGQEEGPDWPALYEAFRGADPDPL